MVMTSEKNDPLMVGTTAADTAYHACRKLYAWDRARTGRAACGITCRLTGHPWSEARQERQDSCHQCVKYVTELRRAEARLRGPRDVLIAGYGRASTCKQIDSPEMQQSIMRTHASRVGLAEPTWYMDAATQGEVPLAKRPAGARLIADLRKGDHVIIAKIDRLSRSILDFIATIDSWSRLGVTIHPCDFPMTIRPDDAACMAFVQMLAVFAGFERRMIGKRTREAKRYHKQIGRKTGPHPPWGFRWVERADGHEYREEVPYESEICLKAAHLALAGYGDKQIADFLTHIWGVVNRRQEPGRPWNPRIMGKVIDRGLAILDERGLSLPAGVRNPKDLRLR
jgi:DNA invertase Pin-like site-specific DNA recombinase